MTDAPASGAETGGENGGAAGAAAIAAGGGVEPSWRDSLPETIRGDAALANFADPGALAQGYLDTKRALSARQPDFTSEEGLKAFADAVRPKEAKEYEIPVPDGQSSEMADKFRDFAHQTGMPPAWAKATAEFYNAQAEAAIAAAKTANEADVAKLRTEMGDGKFTEAVSRAGAMLKSAGVELSDADLQALDGKIGSANLLRYMFHMADRIGDPKPIEGAHGAGVTSVAMTPDQASTRWKEVQQDANWREQAKKAGTPENREYQRLSSLIAQGKRAKPQQRS